MKKFTMLMLSIALLMIAGGNVNAQNSIIVTMGGNGAATYSGDGSSGLYATVNGPTDVCVDAAGNMYVADNANGRIRKIAAATGVITTVATYVNPYYLAIDASGNLYFSTTGAVKEINATTGAITTVAGTGTPGYSGDGGPATAAKIRGQLGICLDQYGNLYIADGTNNRIREVDAATGTINTIVGTGVAGYTGDDSLTAAASELDVPLFVCVDAAGDIYIADQGMGYSSGIISYVTSNAMVIRKVSGSTGIISTFAGFAGGAVTGVLAIDALLGSITGMCLDANGNVYCNEESCSCREINISTGYINYVGGNFGSDAFLDNVNALNGLMNEPHGLCVDATNNVIVADYGNNRVRKIIPVTNAPAFAYGLGQSINACPGYTVSIDTQMAITNSILGQQETFTVITAPTGGILSGFPHATHSKGIDSLTTVRGLSYTANVGFTGMDSFQVMVSNGTSSNVITIYANVAILDPGTISGPSSVCATHSITLTETVSGGTWSAVNTYATITSGNVTGISSGIDTMIYTVTGACAVTTMAVVTVNPMPDAGTIAGAGSVCQGATITIDDLVTGGIWSAASGLATVEGTGLTDAIVTGVTAGTDVIRYSTSNMCGTATATLTVNVLPLPAAGSLSGSSGVCVGTGITLTPTIAGGTWSASNANANVAGLGFVSGVTPGIDSIIYTITDASTGCAGTTAELVTVVSAPDAGVISGPASVCAGASVTIEESVSGGAWSNVNPDADMPIPGTITGVSAGIDTIIYTVSNAYCNSAAFFEITINAAPDAGSISGASSVYTGASTTLYNGVTDGTWSSSNTAISTISATGLVYGVTPGTDSIIYTATNSCGTAIAYYSFTVLAPTGINNTVTGIDKLTIMPNPAKENFTISVSSAFTEPTTIIITNMVGEKVKEITGSTNQPIDASLNAPAGIYLLNASTPHGNMGSKIVIE